MADYTIPGVYGEERAPAVPSVRSPAPLRGALIGKFAAGEKNKFVLIDPVTLESVYGGLIPGSAAYLAAHFFNQGNSRLYVCRVQGTSASVTIPDQKTPPADRIKLTARVDGTWANYANNIGIKATIAAGTLPGTFKLTLTWGYPFQNSYQTYTEAFDNLSIDPDAVRYFKTIINSQSKLVTADDLNPTGTDLPTTGNYSLANGDEPDYDDGISALSAIRGNLCIFLDTQDSNVISALQTAVNNRSGIFPDISADGSIAIVSAPQFSDVNTIIQLAASLADPRMAVSGPYKLIRDPIINTSRYFPESSILAGIRCRLRPEQSWTNKPAYGILDNEYSLSRAEHSTLIENGVSTIDRWLDDPTRGWRVLAGVASDKSQLYVRVAKDWIAAVELSNSAWAVGELQGESDPDPLRTSLRAQSESFWSDLKKQNRIERYRIKCDSENNPPSQVAEGICTKDVEIKLFRVADVIRIRLCAGTESVIATEK
ncbi:MAG: hypothetical protein N2248_00440 [candidate division WOR-3 bacterium]|nr:hypothetical protein [candidate division WOR-3 bacterium]